MKNVRTQEVTVVKMSKWDKGLAQPLATEVFSENLSVFVCMRFVQAIRGVENSFLLGFFISRECSIPVLGICYAFFYGGNNKLSKNKFINIFFYLLKLSHLFP